MKIVVGNQKTYLKRDQVIDFIEKTKNEKCENVIICPSFIYIDYYLDHSNYIIGGQNVCSEESTSRTGEITASQLSNIGASYSIVAHSERRSNYKETGNDFVNKINCLLENDIKPIFCIGETKSEKENGLTKDIVGKQIIEVFDNLNKELLEKIIVAYEPVWSIGTGLVPTNEEIEEMISYIKDFIQDRYNARVLVLYGGSVNKNNIDTLNKIEVVDGYLIGGASTKVDEFTYIMSKCDE